MFSGPVASHQGGPPVRVLVKLRTFLWWKTTMAKQAKTSKCCKYRNDEVKNLETDARLSLYIRVYIIVILHKLAKLSPDHILMRSL